MPYSTIQVLPTSFPFHLTAQIPLFSRTRGILIDKPITLSLDEDEGQFLLFPTLNHKPLLTVLCCALGSLRRRDYLVQMVGGLSLRAATPLLLF